jgi:hypothetical protein
MVSTMMPSARRIKRMIHRLQVTGSSMFHVLARGQRLWQKLPRSQMPQARSGRLSPGRTSGRHRKEGKLVHHVLRDGPASQFEIIFVSYAWLNDFRTARAIIAMARFDNNVLKILF